MALASTSILLSCRQLQTQGPRPLFPAAPPACEELRPINAHLGRIAGVYACARPFRHAGPRIEAQQLGSKLIVHNYGHGGCGWSLSWGSSMQALRLAYAASAGRETLRAVGVIGCGPLGLTSALLAQQAGLSVCIYAKALPPGVPSMGATGIWSPDSRFCDVQHGPAWASRWNEMADASFSQFQRVAQLPGSSIEWVNGYRLSDVPFSSEEKPARTKDAWEPEYAEFARKFLPPQVELPPGSHPFPAPYARGWTSLMFNITSYASSLMTDFLDAGGQIKIQEFTHPDELLVLPEDTLINATGYGAKLLFNDHTIIPVRGQTVRLVPQPEVRYGLRAQDFLVMPRRDGVLIQNMDDAGSFDNSNDEPDYADAIAVVEQVAAYVSRMRC
ncbi:FAD dependent oxidoreductase [Pseudomonas sp. 7SR1]|nr:FAD dependent oxidoreductase [Pseudomonas sp. 7SR1]